MIKKLREQANMTQQEFSDYFEIPKRTVENWDGGQRTPPPYLVKLIEYKIRKEKIGMLKLIQMDHGEETLLTEGYLEDIISYLEENEEIMDWVLDENPGMELPDLEGVETLRELEYELKKIDLSWWTLEVGK